MKYKSSDKVRIKSLDWYNENKDEYGVVLVENGEYMFRDTDTEWCSKIVTIRSVHLSEYYLIEEDGGKYRWTDEMFEGLVEEESQQSIYDTGIIGIPLAINAKYNRLTINDESCSDKVEITLDGYDIIQEGGKWFAVKKKKEYPKTYEECCKVMNYCCNPVSTKTTHKEGLIRRFQFLLMYRDAYWKIAGEEMGLGKPWKPSGNEGCFVISRSCGEVYLYSSAGDCEPFEFPTEEMRDAFKENFDKDLEFCKELL